MKTFIEGIGQVREIGGDLRLQEQLLSDLLKTKVEIDSVEMGISMIWERLSGKRVLIILDDVPEFHEPLVRRWSYLFERGTVIIITTRHENLYQANSIFQVKLMNLIESLELLSWHAFREAKPKEEYHSLAKRVVAYCGGLPLTLEVIGSYLYERTEEEWISALFKLVKIPQHDVERQLKISFDGLHNEMEKDLFLHVSYSFVGKGRAFVKKILNGSGIDVDSGIRVLIERSLIQVNKNNTLGMHSLLQQMGTEIIRQISGEQLGENSQLWFDKTVRTSFVYGFETSFGNCCFLMYNIFVFLRSFHLRGEDSYRDCLPKKIISSKIISSNLILLR